MRTKGYVITASALVLAFLPSPASADEPNSLPKGTACALVLGPIDFESGANAVVSYECADDPAQFVVEGRTRLVRFYSHANFNPNPWAPYSYTFDVYGTAGPCDSAGYMVNDLGTLASPRRSWRYELSSYRVYNNCNFTETWTGPYKSGWWSPLHYGDVSYVGTTWNDNTGSLRLRA
jgi:hypothetical protein